MTTPEGSIGSRGGYGPLFDTNDLVLKKKVKSLKEHYEIEDRLGNSIAKGEGNVVQMPAKFEITDAKTASEIMKIEGQVFSFHNEFDLKDDSGTQLGEIRKKIMALAGEEFRINQNGKEIMRIHGDYLDHDYEMESNNHKVAEIHKKWASLDDQFCISILDDIDHRLVIGAAIVIEHVEAAARANENASSSSIQL